MDTTLITSTAAVLALGAWACAERRAMRWKARHRVNDGAARFFDWQWEKARLRVLQADIDAGIARQRELRLKRSAAQTRRQG